MNRLTGKTCMNYYLEGLAETDGTAKGLELEINAFQKLGKLEDIEDELGIGLPTYFKIKVGVKVYTNLLNDDDLIINYISGSGKDTMYHIVPRNSRSGVYVTLSEYGRSWALTKEELKK